MAAFFDGPNLRGTQTPLRIYNSVHEMCSDPNVVSLMDKYYAYNIQENAAEIQRLQGRDLSPMEREHVISNALRWAGGRDFEEAKAYFLRGADEDEVHEARELLNKIDIEVHGVQGEVWKPQFYGAYPVVPDYLAGDPLCMRTKEQDENEQAPVRVVLDIGVPAKTPQRVIAKRAAAATAFVMKLSETRPVELWIADAGYDEVLKRDYGWRCKLDMPTNMAQVMAAFNPSVNRMLMLHYAHQLAGGKGHYDRASLLFALNGVAGGYPAQYRRELVKYLQLDKDDIVLHTLLDTDAMEAIDLNPVKWVKDMLLEHGVQADDY